MTPAHIPGTIPCPFPPCTAEVSPVVHRTDPKDPSKTTRVVPMHDVEGPNGWFGRCPASMFVVPELSANARRVLSESLRVFARMLAHRINQQVARGDYPARMDDEQYDPNNPGGVLDQPGVRLGRPRGDGVDTDAFFPVRPAETEEYEPTTNRGKGVASRDELIAMVRAAREAAGGCQEGSALLTVALDDAERAINKIAQEQQIGAAMTVAGIGGAETGAVPEPAQNMLSSFSRLGELLIEAREAIGLLRQRNDGMFRVAGRAAENADTYSRQI